MISLYVILKDWKRTEAYVAGNTVFKPKIILIWMFVERLLSVIQRNAVPFSRSMLPNYHIYLREHFFEGIFDRKKIQVNI